MLTGHYHSADRSRPQVQYRRAAHPQLDRVGRQVQENSRGVAMQAPVGQPGWSQPDRSALAGIPVDLKAVLLLGPLRIDRHTRVTSQAPYIEHGDVGIVILQ